MDIQNELNEFVNKINDFCLANCPSFLTPNSSFMGIKPGHSLDLFEISFDFKVDRYAILKADIPDVLKDPSKVELKVVK